jgi:para-nitrobenzyl esterase
MQIRTKAACVLTTAALAIGLSMTSNADPLKVKTDQGKVQGKTINDGKVNAFLGLPYAAPPVGDLRWKAPEPANKWKGTRDATKFGAHCAQGREIGRAHV